MGSRIKPSLRRKNLGLRSPSNEIARALPREAIAGFEWLALCLINPGLLNEVASDLLNTCEQGSRHFAANGRSVELSEASKMAREIRCYDLEKVESSVASDDAPLAVHLLSTHAKLRTSTGGLKQSGSAAPIPEEELQEKEQIEVARATAHLRATKRGISAIQSNAKRDGVARGERHFDGVNTDDVQRSMDEFLFHIHRAESS